MKILISPRNIGPTPWIGILEDKKILRRCDLGLLEWIFVA
jgi:hypothetical protein